MALNGWRGAGLLFLALTSALARGIRYTFDSPDYLPTGLYDLSFSGTVIHALGIMWLLAAVLGVWSAFRLKDLLGVFALAFMHALWAVALFLGWLLAGHDGEWLSGVATFGTFLLIVCWSRMVNPPRMDVEELLRHRSGVE